MSQATDKLMSLELEFIDQTSHGFISWVDFDSGEQLATLGLGSTAKDIQVDGQGNQVGVDNGGPKFLEWNLLGVDFIKITGGSIQFDEERSLIVDSTRDVISVDEFGDETITVENYNPSQILLNAPDYTDESIYEPASVIYRQDLSLPFEDQDPRYQELTNIKNDYVDNTNAMVFEHENAIVFANPVSKRLLGVMDTVNESFGWYGSFSLGSVVDDSYFEIKRTQNVKRNFTLNADTDYKPEIGFKYEDVLVWSVRVEDNNFHIKNESGYGVEVLNDEDAVKFTGEIIYNDTPLIDYFYIKPDADDKFVDVAGDVMTGNLTAPTFIGSLTGNASSSTSFENPITLNAVGDAVGSVSFDGSEGSVDFSLSVSLTNYYTKQEIDDKLNVLDSVDHSNPSFPLGAPVGTTVYSSDDLESEVFMYVKIADGKWAKFISDEIVSE
jgi:hypothetical protein